MEEYRKLFDKGDPDPEASYDDRRILCTVSLSLQPHISFTVTKVRNNLFATKISSQIYRETFLLLSKLHSSDSYIRKDFVTVVLRAARG